MHVYTIYNGIIEKHEVIRKTNTGYRVLHGAYKTGRQISGSKVSVDFISKHKPHSGVKYVTELISEALECAKQYGLRIKEQQVKIQESIEHFENDR